MARPSTLEVQRRDALPELARAFAELGFRRATTAELSRRTELNEAILFRIWPSKKAMFLDTIEYVYDLAADTYRRVAADAPAERAAEVLLDYEAGHLGAFGHYRILFAGLSEADDPDIRRALQRCYRRFADLVRDRLAQSRLRGGGALDGTLSAWAIVGVATIATIARELDLMNAPMRRDLLAQVGRTLASATST